MRSETGFEIARRLAARASVDHENSSDIRYNVGAHTTVTVEFSDRVKVWHDLGGNDPCFCAQRERRVTASLTDGQSFSAKEEK